MKSNPMNQKKKNLIILTGPTAVGKTALSIGLAKAVGGEIISADSIQVYKHMDIGSAKITREEMDGVPHHLIDILPPTEPFNIVRFKELCEEAMDGIYARGRLPVITGGTGFYIQAVLNDITFAEEEDDGFRAELEILAEEKGSAFLYEMLKETDPASCEIIHQNNLRRVIRALEYHHKTGEKISEANAREREKESAYNSAYFVLTMDRAKLYQRIEQRIDEMLSQGLVDEVKRLIDEDHVTAEMTSMQGLGYKEIYAYLKGEMTYEEAVYTLKRDTRHFAKRQLTWFKRERDVIWVDKDTFSSEDAILDYMIKILHDKNIM